LKRRDEERQFLAQLLDGSKVEQYQIPVKINAELRKYQQEGVNWLAFLAKYQLHGILCDGMYALPSAMTAHSIPLIQTWALERLFSQSASLQASTSNALNEDERLSLLILSIYPR
jgi:hypothetical protein